MWWASFYVLLGSTIKVDEMFTWSYRNTGSVPATGRLWWCTLLALGLLVGPPKSPGAVTQVGDAIAHWRFDEGSGTSALDSSTNSHDGTIVGATYVSCRFDGALSFNGANGYVFISDAQGGNITGAGLDSGTREWTVSAWRGEGALQSSGDTDGPWEDVPGATRPHAIMVDSVKRFYRVIVP